MAFTSRADRKSEFLSPAKGISDLVGPGSYTLPREHRVVHGHAPFSSTSDRRMASSNGVGLITPGPGSYDTPILKPNTTPHAVAVLNQTAPRWKSEKDNTLPGPGSYDLPTAFKPKKRPRSAGHKTNVVWFRAPTAPSIPIPQQAHGYEETPTGELIPQKPPLRGYTGRKGDTVGPGGYDVVESVHRIEKPKATDFGKSRTQRVGVLATAKESEKETLPGPGQYDWAQSVDPPPRMKRPTATFVSRVLRAHEKPQHEEDEAPGPGAYDAHMYHAIKPKVVPEVLQCFGSTSRRTIDVPDKSAGPGPGAYKTNVAPWDLAKRKPLFDANRAPFASSSSRFVKLGGGEDELPPGPGQYTKADFITELQRSKFGRGGHFGTTSRRFDSGKKDDDEDINGPGPGQYEFKQPKFIAGTLRKGPSSVFASSSERFEKIRKEKEVRPAPGQYDVAADLVKKSNRAGKIASFASTAERFNHKTTASEEPGPGSYAAAHGSIEHRLLTRPERPTAGFGAEQRFKSPTKTLPVGPGQYDPVDPYGGLIKRSFNVTIESGFL